MIGLTKTLANEWSPYNVNVNAVGFVYQPADLDPMAEAALLARVERRENRPAVGFVNR